MRILAIETSCDETGLAILDCKGGAGKPRIKIVKEVVASQIKVHQPFGGVVPTLAKREHIKNLPVLFKKVFGFDHLNAKRALPVDLIAVTSGPGLEPALWTGITFAKALAKTFKKPVVGANHMEGHLYSPLLESEISIAKGMFPAIALIVSGGHTILLRMDSLTSWKKLGETRDDAAGEAYDKAARLLSLPYPGGPEIYKLAVKYAKSKTGAAKHGTIPFPSPCSTPKIMISVSRD
jgi:N6-L-threonylcarbamoyladenine synthase